MKIHILRGTTPIVVRPLSAYKHMLSFNAGLRTILLSYDFGDELKGDLVSKGITASQQRRLSVKASFELLPINAMIKRFYSLFFNLSRLYENFFIFFPFLIFSHFIDTGEF